MRRTQASDCRTLPFPPDRVWRVLADFAAYPAWWPRQLRLEVLHVGGGLVGSRFRVRPFGSHFVCAVAGAEAGRELRIEYVGGAHRGTGVWTLHPAGDATRVCYAVDLEPHGLFLRLLSHALDFGKLHSHAMAGVFDGLEDRLRRGVDGR